MVIIIYNNNFFYGNNNIYDRAGDEKKVYKVLIYKYTH